MVFVPFDDALFGPSAAHRIGHVLEQTLCILAVLEAPEPRLGEELLDLGPGSSGAGRDLSSVAKA